MMVLASLVPVNVSLYTGGSTLPVTMVVHHAGIAVMTNELLRGAKPEDIPYYQMTKFDLVLNRATARSLGLDFPPILLATANDIIE